MWLASVEIVQPSVDPNSAVKAVQGWRDHTRTGWFDGGLNSYTNEYSGSMATFGPVYIGTGGGLSYNGDVAEILIYPNALPSADKSAVFTAMDNYYYLTCPALAAINGTNGDPVANKADCSGINARWGNECRQACNAGLVRTYGTFDHVCTQGEWSGSNLICERECPPLSPPLYFDTCTRRMINKPSWVSNAADLDNGVWVTSPAVPRSERGNYWSVNASSGMLLTRAGIAPCRIGAPSLLYMSAPRWVDVVLPSMQTTVQVAINPMSGVLGFAVRVTDANNYYLLSMGVSMAGVPSSGWAALTRFKTGLAPLVLTNVTVDFYPGTAYTVALTMLGPAFSLSLSTAAMPNPLTAFSNVQNGDVSYGGVGLYSAGVGSFGALQVTTECDSGGSCTLSTPGVTCSYTCAPGYVLVSGDAARSCSAMAGGVSMWNGQPAICSLQPPVFQNISQQLTVLENSAADTSVGSPIVATTPASRVTILYSIVAEYPPPDFPELPRFAIGACSGQVYVASTNSSLDYEQTSSFMITVQAMPNGFPASAIMANFTVQVIDVPEKPFFPPFDSPTAYRNVSEDATLGTPIGDPVAAIDPDLRRLVDPSDTLQYMIEIDPSNGLVAVDPSTGQLYVARVPGLDFETTPSYRLRLRVFRTLQPSLFDFTDAFVSVLNANDRPTMPPTQIMEVMPQDAALGNLLPFPIGYYDQDGNADSVTFSILGGNADPNDPSVTAVFGLNSTTGRLSWAVDRSNWSPEAPTFVVGTRLVYAVYQLVAGVTDSGGLGASGNIVVYLMVNGTGGGNSGGGNVGAPTLSSLIVGPGPNSIDAPTTGGTMVTFNGTNLPLFSNVLASYGPTTTSVNTTRTYVGANCVVTLSTTLVCYTSPGVGRDLSWEVAFVDPGTGMRTVAARTAPLLMSYAAPAITLIANANNLNTEGGEVVTITGTGFGTDPSLISLTWGPQGQAAWMTARTVRSVTQTQITFEAGEGFGQFNAINLLVGGQAAPATIFTISYGYPNITKLGVGSSLYTQSTLPWGFVAIQVTGNNFGPRSIPGGSASTVPFYIEYGPAVAIFLGIDTFATSFVLPCYKFGSTPHRYMDCFGTATSTGANLAVRAVVSGVGGYFSHRTISGPAGYLSHMAPVITSVTGPGTRLADTAGAQGFTIQGSGFGPVGYISPTSSSSAISSNPLLLEVRYGNNGRVNTTNPATMGNRAAFLNGYSFAGLQCSVTKQSVALDPTASIQCVTSPGIGTDLELMLNMANQFSSPYSRAISYGPPIISSFDGPGANGADTRGGQNVTIYGKNFYNNITAVAVYYSLQLDPTASTGLPVGALVVPPAATPTGAIRLNPTSCSFLTPHSAITCMTSPGAGANLKWTMTVAGQASRDPFTFYASPLIMNVTDRLPGDPNAAFVNGADPAGGTTAFITGSFFGPGTGSVDPNGNPGFQYPGRMLQWVRYSLPGSGRYTYLPPANYTIIDHSTIQVKIGPGFGTGLSFDLMVGDQRSQTASGGVNSFSYRSPTLVSVSPTSGVSTAVDPLTLTLTAADLPGDDTGISYIMVFGNVMDATQTSIPCAKGASTVMPNNQGIRTTLRCPVPEGYGQKRQVQLILSSSGSTAVVAKGGPFYFDFTTPVLNYFTPLSAGSDPWQSRVLSVWQNPSNVRVISVIGVGIGPAGSYGNTLASRQVLVNSSATLSGNNAIPAAVWTGAVMSDGDVGQSLTVVYSFGPTSMVIMTKLFSIRVALQQTVVGDDVSTFLTSTSNTLDLSNNQPKISGIVGPTTGYTIGLTSVQGVLSLEIPWGTINSGGSSGRRVLGQTAPSSRHSCPLCKKDGGETTSSEGGRALQAGPNVPMAINITSFVPQADRSTAAFFSSCGVLNRDFSGNKVGDPGISNSMNTVVSTGAAADFVWQVCRDYYTSNFQPLADASPCRLHCVITGGQGDNAQVGLIINNKASPFSAQIGFAAPLVRFVDVMDSFDGTTTTYDVLANPTTPIVLPTAGAKLTVRGDNLGVYPNILMGPAPGAGASLYGVYTYAELVLNSNPNVGVSNTNNNYRVMVPGLPGEGYQNTFALTNGLPTPFALTVQTSLVQTNVQPAGRPVPLRWASPTITGVTSSAPANGGTTFNITGRNFGAPVPGVPTSDPIILFLKMSSAGRRLQAAGGSYPPIRCSNPVRVSSTFISCTVPPGAGAGYTVSVTIANQTGTIANAFSYLRPSISNLVVETWPAAVYNNWPTTWNRNRTRIGTPTFAQYGLRTARGPTNGRYMVTLNGAQFGPRIPQQSCVFVSHLFSYVDCSLPANAQALQCLCTSASIANGNPACQQSFVNLQAAATFARAPFQAICDGFESFNGEGEVYDGSDALALSPQALELRRGDDKFASGYIMSWTDSSVTFTMPPGAGVVLVTVGARGQFPWMHEEALFTYDAPQLTGFTSLSRSVSTNGADLTVITGTNLGLGFPLVTEMIQVPRVFPPVTVPGLPFSTFSPFGNGITEMGIDTAYSLVASRRALPIAEGFIVPAVGTTLRLWTSCLSTARIYDTPRPVGGYASPPFIDDGGSGGGGTGGACDNKNATFYEIVQHRHNYLLVRMHPGIGALRNITLQFHSPSVLMSSSAAPLAFSYDRPNIRAFRPSNTFLVGGDTFTVTVAGLNFGRLEDDANWSPEDRAVGLFLTTTGSNPSAGDITSLSSPSRQVPSPDDAALGYGLVQGVIDSPASMVMGPQSISVLVAGQTGNLFANSTIPAPAIFGCKPGFYGNVSESCWACPTGAVCQGYDVINGIHNYPRPLPYFFNANGSMFESACPPSIAQDANGAGSRQVCIVSCLPGENCAGDNYCTEGYRSLPPYYRCSSCEINYYRRSGECVRCPESPGMLIVGLFLIAAACIGVGYLFNRLKVNVAFVTIAMDFFQVLSVFLSARVPWPPALKELLSIFAAFNFNIDITVPECLVPALAYQTKWGAIMLLPVVCAALLLLIFLARVAFARFIKKQKGRAAMQHLANSLIATFLTLAYFLYLFISRTLLEPFNCLPAPGFDDGQTYMAATGEPCGGPTQKALVAPAIIGIIFFTIGYPMLVAWILWKHRFWMQLDQLLLAGSSRYDRVTNPSTLWMHQRYSRLYYAFKPDYHAWILAVIARKFAISFAALMFRSESSFQMAVILFFLFVAFAAQVRHQPYLGATAAEKAEVMREHERRRYESDRHARLAEQLKAVSLKAKKKGRAKIDWSAPRAAVALQVMGNAAAWFASMNVLESVLLAASLLVALAGIMLVGLSSASVAISSSSSSSVVVLESASRVCNPIYQSYCDGLTAGVILLIVATIIYIVAVIIAEFLAALNDNKLRAASAATREAMLKKARANGKVRRTSYDGRGGLGDPSLTGDSERDFKAKIGLVEESQNPLFENNPLGLQTADGKLDAAGALAILDSEAPPSKPVWKVIQEFAKTTLDTSTQQAELIADLKRQLAQAELNGPMRRSPGGGGGGGLSLAAATKLRMTSANSPSVESFKNRSARQLILGPSTSRKLFNPQASAGIERTTGNFGDGVSSSRRDRSRSPVNVQNDGPSSTASPAVSTPGGGRFAEGPASPTDGSSTTSFLSPIHKVGAAAAKATPPPPPPPPSSSSAPSSAPKPEAKTELRTDSGSKQPTAVDRLRAIARRSNSGNAVAVGGGSNKAAGAVAVNPLASAASPSRELEMQPTGSAAKTAPAPPPPPPPPRRDDDEEEDGDEEFVEEEEEGDVDDETTGKK